MPATSPQRITEATITMYHRLFYSVPLIISLCLYHGSIKADTELIYTQQTNSVFGNPTIIQIQGSKVRMERNGGDLYLIYDHNTQTLFSINPKNQTYVTNTLATIRARTEHLVAMQQQFTQQLKKQIEELPERQRAATLKRLEQAEKMLKIPQPKFAIEYDTKTDLILGKPCKIARFKVRTQLMRTLCYAPHSIINAEDFQQLKAMFEFMNQLAQEAARIQEQTQTPINLNSLIFEDSLILRNHNTVPDTQEELSVINTAPLDVQLFTIPSDYAELEPNNQPPSIPHFIPLNANPY